MDLRPGHLETVKKILAAYVPKTEVLAFGSRVTGSAREHSDLALRGTDTLNPPVLRDLRVAFEESDLPIRVDVVDWNRISDRFRRIIKRKFEIISSEKSFFQNDGLILVSRPQSCI
jgi:predicted nucleotidyltransferase